MTAADAELAVAPRWLHLEMWTSPAGVERAERCGRAERLLAEASDAVVSLFDARSAAAASDAMTHVMDAVEQAQEVLRDELGVLRRANCPSPHPRGWRPSFAVTA